jgi:DNA repair protein RecO
LNYGETDRILTVITKEAGKLRLMAKGVRKSTSKLAGGIELFSESDIQYIKGRGEIDTLVSTRIKKHFGKITENLARTQAGYEMINAIDHLSEHAHEENFYDLLSTGLEQLNSKTLSTELILCVFYMHVLEMTGHGLNLVKDIYGDNFSESSDYQYNFDAGGFEPVKLGHASGLIKLLRLIKSLNAKSLERITGAEREIESSLLLLRKITEYYLNIKQKRN